MAVDAASKYISKSDASCTQTFTPTVTVTANDGTPAKADVTVDAAGAITVDTSAAHTGVYTVSIAVKTADSDGKGDTVTIDGITITTACGAASTVITPPKFAPATQTQKISAVDPPKSTADNLFVSSNAVCPITGVVLTQTPADSCEATGAANNKGLPWEVTLLASKKETVGTYAFVLTATATGGATAKASGEFIIEA